MPSNGLLRQIPPVALFIQSFIVQQSQAYVFPRETKTVEFRELSVQPWPLLEFSEAPSVTAAPVLPDELRARQLNTVCGYIGGDPGLPATCSAGSHCVAADEGYIGCCPDSGSCTQGVFTGCVDENSDPQTELDPYVYTCSGSEVCYRNTFDGGFFQYGCGSSQDATSVEASASGGSSVDLSTVSAPMTATAITLSEPTTLETQTSKTSSSTTSSTDSTSTTSSTTTSSTTQSASQSSSTETTSTATSASTTVADSEATTSASHDDDGDDDGDGTNVAAIVGGVVGGVVLVIALILLAVCLSRRKKMMKNGKGRRASGNFEQMNTMTENNNNFGPPPTWEQATRDRMPQTTAPAPAVNREGNGHYDEFSDPIPYSVPYNPYQHQADPDAVSPAGPGHSSDEMPVSPEGDRMPLTREVDDFSNGYNAAVGGMGPELHDGTEDMSTGDPMYPVPRGGTVSRPLWHQNRRQSRGLIWM